MTPSSYSWTHANRVETVQLDQVGEINLPGGALLGSCTLEALLPARLYSFCNPGAVANPYRYLEQLERWSDSGTPVRFLVSGTPTNALVLIESVEYGEQDGTNDIYATIILRQYRKPETPVVAVSSGTATGPDRPPTRRVLQAHLHRGEGGQPVGHRTAVLRRRQPLLQIGRRQQHRQPQPPPARPGAHPAASG